MAVEVKVYSDLDAVAADAGGALDRAAQASLFDRLDWFRLTLAHCPPPGTPLILRASDGGASAWLFLAGDRAAAAPLMSWYSLRARPIISGSLSEFTRNELFRHIFVETRSRGITRISLGPMSMSTARATLSAAAAAGWRGVVDDRPANWRIDTSDTSFAAYWASRPSRLRSTVERQLRRANFEIEVHPRFDPAVWAAYEAVYARSWKPQEGSPAFLRRLAQAESAAGALRLGIARLNGEPVAAQYWLVENGVATIHKLAHVEEHAGLSPGTLLSAAMFRDAIDTDHVSRIDFGLGDEAYKADWMAERRLLARITLFDPRSAMGLAGLLRARARQLVAAARSR